jgi:heme A synthase
VPVQTKQLRILSTLLLAFAVAQAGLGSGYLDGGRGLLIAHATNAFAVLVLTVLSVVFGFSYRRSGGPSWVFYLPLALVVAVVVQLGLGFSGVRSFHVFWGVLYLCGVTTFCSYTYRLLPEDRPRAAAAGRPA